MNNEMIYNLIQEATLEQKLKNLKQEVTDKIDFVKCYIDAIDSAFTDEELKEDVDMRMAITMVMEELIELSSRVKDIQNKVYTIKSMECLNMILDCEMLIESLGIQMDNLRKFTL